MNTLYLKMEFSIKIFIVGFVFELIGVLFFILIKFQKGSGGFSCATIGAEMWKTFDESLEKIRSRRSAFLWIHGMYVGFTVLGWLLIFSSLICGILISAA